MCAKLPCANISLCWQIMQNKQKTADLQKTKVNVTKIRKVCVDGNKFYTGKNGGHRPSNLGSRPIVVVSE